MRTPNPRQIELARLSRGYTQKELSSLLPNLNQSSLSKVEKGLLTVSEETLESLSKTLSYPISFFCQEELKTPMSNIYFRKRATVPQKELDRIFSDLKIILKGIDYLTEEIEVAQYNRYSFDLSAQGWTPQDVAMRMRELMKIPSGPVKDIVNLLENEGVLVYFYDCGNTKFDGLTAYTDSGIPVIFINKNMPNDRIRFTIAHEFFHLISHIPCDIEPWRDVENEANTFASEFLMPARDCFRDLPGLSFNKLGILKAYWGVSKAAIIMRAKHLSAINESTYRYLLIELGRRNERKNETGFVEIDQPKLLPKIIDLLKSELQKTDSEIAETMNLTVIDYFKYFENGRAALVRTMKRAV